MIKEIPKSDVVVRPFKVYKEWTLDDNDITKYIGEKDETTLFDTDTDEKSNGFYKRLLYRSIESEYYRTPTTASILTEVGLRQSYTSTDERNLAPDIIVLDGLGNRLTDDDGNEIVLDGTNEMIIIPIPQRYYGEGVKIGSMVLTDTTKNIRYTDDGNSNLINSVDGEIDGNIFYDRGLIVMRGVFSTTDFLTFTVNFRSTMTIYENEILLNVLENEFNVSQNPTAYDSSNGNIKLHTIQSSLDSTKFGGFGEYDYSSSVDPTGSYIAPYITTIGLYDDSLNMVAVAKLPKPIKSLPDYPLNFIVRFDT
jgi:hypothetical protein